MKNQSLRSLLVWRILSMIAFIIVALSAMSDAQTIDQTFWADVSEAQVAVVGNRLIVPVQYRTLGLDLPPLRLLLAQAPLEGLVRARESQFIVSLPLPQGGFGRFRVVESPIMEPELAAKFPEIKTYLGQGIDDPTASTRFDITPAGFHAIIFSPDGTIYIDPYAQGTTSYYISYYKRFLAWDPSRAWSCEGPIVDDDRIVEQIKSIINQGLVLESGNQLRTYRTAVAATGEYTVFHGGTVSLGLAAIVTAMNRVNGVYEREVAIRMTLVANNNLIVYTNASTDPYSNTNGSAMLTQNITTLNSIIGSANYDIGHVFSTGGGGVAYLGSVCGSSKAGGVTGQSSPIGDPFTIDYVAHEIGHQFGGNHTFNGDAGSCSGNRVSTAAYEPGSGTTIMAYAGICSPQNIQMNSDDYFHGTSFDEIIAFSTLGSGNGCATITSTGNTAPTVNAGVTGLTIPISTPFMLTGSGSDLNGDALQYCWEEFDLGAAGAPNSPSGTAPIFRSFNPTTSPSRIFPKLSDILNNTQTMGEILPNYGRALTFRLTARDYRAGGGGVGKSTNVAFTVNASAGPFVVTSPNTAVTWAGGSTQTVTWNVASTNVSPVSCTNVKISLSTDGGQNWQYVLASSTPNDGTESVVMPNVAATTARMKVEAVGNIFFDLSNTNFTITSSAGTITVVAPNGAENWPIGMSQTIQWNSSGVTGNVKIELSRNSGSTYETLFASTANDGSESWSVSSPTTSTALIRVSSVDQPSVSDVSNANFSIVQPTITVTAPNGGETWAIGTSRTITWSSSNLTGNVNIELSRNGGSTYETLFSNTSNDGTEAWTVAGATSSTARIRVTSVSIPTLNDVSDANFSIVQPTLTVTAPNGGETWVIGTSQTITWTSSNVTGNVKIEVSRNNGSSYEVLVASTTNDGTEAWAVTGAATASALVRISSVDLPSVSDVSNANFSISPVSLTVTAPNGGEIWPIGSSQTINWTSSNLSGNVKIELSRDGGLTFPELLFASTVNDGAETWVVVGTATPQARIRISSVTTPSVADTSNADFAIGQPSLTVTVPNGGESWAAGSVQNIQWSSFNLASAAKIELSRDGGSSYETIISSTPNDGSESWTVTTPTTIQAVIRITSVGYPSVSDMSNAIFSIASPYAFLTDITVRDNGGGIDRLFFGTAAGATDGIDPQFGEEELPPVPPAGAFDVRWQISGTLGAMRNIRQPLSGLVAQVIYTGQYQVGLGGYPVTLRWNRADLPSGLFILRDLFGGMFFKVNMRLQDSLIITSSALTSFQILYKSGDTLRAAVSNRWNVVSLPLTVSDRRATAVFPAAISGATTFNGSGYVTDSLLQYGVGYWMKFNNADTLTFGGSYRDLDTLELSAGWQTIGTISYPVSTASIIQIPSGIVASPFFGYTPVGYATATTLQPMQGYWVKLSVPGRLVLIGNEAARKRDQNIRHEEGN